MNIRNELRLSNKYISIDSLSANEYNYLANNFFDIPKDELQLLLTRLRINYQTKLINNEEDEFLILNDLISYLSLDLSDEDFKFYSEILTLIIHSSFRNSEEHQKLFQPFLESAPQFLESNNLIIISCTLSVFSNLTSLSDILSQYVLSNIPLHFFYDFILNGIDFTDTNIFYKFIIQNSSIILRNVFYCNSIEEIDKESIDNLFKIVETLCESKQINIVPDLIPCIRDIIIKDISYYSEIIEHGLIQHFNMILYIHFNDDDESEDSQELTYENFNEFTLIYILDIFHILIKNKIGLNIIDPLMIYKIIPTDSDLSLKAMKVFVSFLQKSPDSSDVFFELDILSVLDHIFQFGTFDSKIQALNIIFNLLKNGSQENCFELIQIPNLINSILEMACDLNEFAIRLIFKIFEQFLQISDIFDYHEQLKEIFMEASNIVMLEELANRESTSSIMIKIRGKEPKLIPQVGEIATRFLHFLNDDDDEN